MNDDEIALLNDRQRLRGHIKHHSHCYGEEETAKILCLLLKETVLLMSYDGEGFDLPRNLQIAEEVALYNVAASISEGD